MKKIFAILSLFLVIGMIVNFSPEISPPEKQEIIYSPESDQFTDQSIQANELVYLVESNSRVDSNLSLISLPIEVKVQEGISEKTMVDYTQSKPTYSDKEKDPGRCGFTSFS